MSASAVVNPRIAELEEILTEAAQAYYDTGTSNLDDWEYDAFEAELRRMDPSNAVLKAVGTKPASSGTSAPWKKITHLQPMGSLNKVQTIEEYNEWVGKINGDIVELNKFDGLSLSLRYVAGAFVQAVTRGDGIEGDDVTANVLKMAFPKTLVTGATCFIRGEVMIKKSVFAKHFPGERNPRNSAVGTLKRLDGARCEHLSLFVYDYLPDIGPLPHKSTEIATLKSLGFETGPCEVSRAGTDFVAASYQRYINSSRAALDYEIDGLVLVVDNLETRAAMGIHDQRPKGAVALKFPHAMTTSTLRNIVYQVGSSGRIAPVAEFDEVNLAGANVTRASLHNMGYIQRLGGLSPGSKIVVSRRNDVIPAVESVTFHNNSNHFLPPTHCPECSTPLVYEGEYLMCKGTACPSQVVGVIRNWIEKIGVLHFGESLVEALVASGKVKTIVDLYLLDAETVGKLTFTDGRNIGLSIATKAITNLHAKKTLPLALFLGSMSIPLIGRSMTQIFVDAGYDSIEKMGCATAGELSAIPGVGPTKAAAFMAGLHHNSSLICQLYSVDVTPEAPKVKAVGCMTDKVMVMTGFRDKDLQAAFEALGGTVKDSVSKHTNYLVAKDVSGNTGKLKDARDKGITVLSLAEMQQLLANA